MRSSMKSESCFVLRVHLLLLVSLLCSGELFGEDDSIVYNWPLQVSLTPDAQLIGKDEGVGGLRLSLPYGSNESVLGLDVGFYNETTRDAIALQVAVLCNVAQENADALQIALFNYVGNEMTGIQIGGLNSVERGAGVQIAGLWSNAREVDGAQISGLVNLGHEVNGFQIGTLNISTYFSGLQIGLVNWAKNAKCLQIGLVNIVQNGALPVMIGINFNL